MIQEKIMIDFHCFFFQIILCDSGIQQPRLTRKGMASNRVQAGGRDHCELQPWDAGIVLFDSNHADRVEQAWGIQGIISCIDVNTLVCECIAKTTKMVISVEEEY